MYETKDVNTVLLLLAFISCTRQNVCVVLCNKTYLWYSLHTPFGRLLTCTVMEKKRTHKRKCRAIIVRENVVLRLYLNDIRKYSRPINRNAYQIFKISCQACNRFLWFPSRYALKTDWIRLYKFITFCLRWDQIKTSIKNMFDRVQ